MYQCPDCLRPLLRQQGEVGIFWACEGCGKRLIGLSLLRRTVNPEFLNEFWQKIRKDLPDSQTRLCPACSKPMIQTPLPPSGSMDFFFCGACSSAWLSPEERNALPAMEVSWDEKISDLSKLPPEAAKTAALAEVEIMAEKARDPYEEFSTWKLILCYTGLPVASKGEEGWKRIPWGTIFVTIAAVGASIHFLPLQNSVAQVWGFIPAQWSRHGGLTTLSSFFLHGNWVHLFGNMYCLLLFGLRVENKIGLVHFLILLFLSTALGDALTYFWDPAETGPGIGASGGIAGVMVFFALAFPRAVIAFGYLPLPAVYAMGLWLLFQGVYGSIQVKGWEEGIGYFAHFGGGLFGLVYWFLFRKKLGLGSENKKSVFDL